MTYQKAPDISVRTMADEVFILDRKSSAVHTFNATGAHLWHTIAAGKPVNEICVSLCDEFDVPPDQAQADVADFIDNLIKNSLIIPVAAEPAQ